MPRLTSVGIPRTVRVTGATMIHPSTATASLRVTINTGRRLSWASAHQISPWVGVTLTRALRQSSEPTTHQPTRPPSLAAGAIDTLRRSSHRSRRVGSDQQAARGQAVPPPIDSRRPLRPRGRRPQRQDRHRPSSPTEPCKQHSALHCRTLFTLLRTHGRRKAVGARNPVVAAIRAVSVMLCACTASSGGSSARCHGSRFDRAARTVHVAGHRPP